MLIEDKGPFSKILLKIEIIVMKLSFHRFNSQKWLWPESIFGCFNSQFPMSLNPGLFKGT